MLDIKQREEKMGEKIKNIPWKEFIFRLASWKSFMFYKNPEVTLYPPTGRVGPLLSVQDYEKQRIGFEKYGIDYDSSKDFFHHYQQLFTTIPCIRLKILLPYENSDYIDSGGFGIKNCYLSIGPFSDSQNVLYSFEVKEKCSDVVNSVMVRHNCANIYQSTGIINSYKIFYCRYISDSSNLRFCTNMIGCQECIDCDGLQNQSYCIANKQYSKEEFTTKKEEFLKEKHLFHQKFLNLNPQGANLQSTNVGGSFNVKCDNIETGYLNFNVHGGNNLILVGSANGNKEIYNTFVCGSPHMDHGYHVIDSGGGDYIYNAEWIAMSSHIYYSFYLENCSYCLGCIGLKNKQFCILNKQYAKEERFTLADKIFTQMEKDGSLGNYFPGYINPFYFNDTAAYLLDDSFTKEEVTKEGYLRRDEEIKVDVPEGAEIISSSPSPFSCREGEDFNKRIHEIVKENRIYGESGGHQVGFAREMRKNPTEVEEMLWEILRNRNFLGSKRRRQFPINKYIADFYCHDAKLILELDGSIHDLEQQKEIDKRKDEDMHKLGYKIVRFKNRDIHDKLEYVLKEIADHLVPSQQERGIRGEEKTLSDFQGFENGKRSINPEILKKVIKDEKGNYYRIVKMEYDFLMKYGLPLPKLHRLERIKLGFKFK